MLEIPPEMASIITPQSPSDYRTLHHNQRHDTRYLRRMAGTPGEISLFLQIVKVSEPKDGLSW